MPLSLLQQAEAPVARFNPTHRFAWEEPPAGIQSADLLPFVPDRLKAHPNCSAFLQAVVDWLAECGAMDAGEGAATPAEVRDQLAVVGAAAATMRQALVPLADGSAAAVALQAPFDYLAVRARQVFAPKEGRPVVPALPPDVPPLVELLRRLDQDLQSLRTACQYTAERVRVDRNPEKLRERRLVVGVAVRYEQAFGRLPPQRDWFVDTFMVEIGRLVGRHIGRGVVGEAVKSLR